MYSKDKDTEMRTMHIFYKVDNGRLCSILQTMSKYNLGVWIWYLIDKGYKVCKVEVIDE